MSNLKENSSMPITWAVAIIVFVFGGTVTVLGMFNSINNHLAHLDEHNWTREEMSAYMIATGEMNPTMKFPHVPLDDKSSRYTASFAEPSDTRVKVTQP